MQLETNILYIYKNTYAVIKNSSESQSKAHEVIREILPSIKLALRLN